ncbi:ABC transporter permease [Clostridium lundense]|uniref:ABC transporter permease n=1 Tax=Clostridium lundense TaxID=319475 RepID=UPI00047F578E|nr:ABC transporter permease [Clostridium lundense]
MKIKYAIKGLSRRFFYSFLIILQLTFGFYSIYENINLNKSINAETSKVERFFKDKLAYSLEVDHVSKNINFSSMEKAFNKLENSPDYTFLKNVLVTLYVKVFDNYNEFERVRQKWTIDNETYFIANNMTINKEYLNTYPLEVKEGRLFNDNEFKFVGKENYKIPIVVGANYGKYFKVGDELDIRWLKSKFKCKIIGILEKDQLSPGDIREPDKRYINLNNYIISTDSIYDDRFSLYLYSLFNGNYILFDKGTSQVEIDKNLKNIEEMFNNIKGVSYPGIRDLSSYMKQDTEVLEEQRRIVSVTSITIIIFVCATFIISLLEAINKRKFEYGIHIMSGGTLCDIAIISYLEIFILFLSSYALTFTLIYRKYGALINIDNIIILFIIMMFISIISAIIPLIKIFNLDIDHLIKGEE